MIRRPGRPWLALLVAGTCGAADLQITVTDTAGMPVENAIVYATAANPVAQSPRKATIDQVNKQFVPLVSVVQRGAAVWFPNSDNIRHSVYSFSDANRFTLKLYAGVPAGPVVFPKAGIVTIGCNIHDKMIAWILVVDTPYFARTDATGKATITGLAPDSYTLRAWRSAMRAEQPGELLQIGAEAPRMQVLHVPVGDTGAMPDMAH